jgi:hypothetical protein
MAMAVSSPAVAGLPTVICEFDPDDAHLRTVWKNP